MHPMNLDLLNTTPHHPDGTARDSHAHHRATLTALRRARRRATLARWAATLAARLTRRPTGKTASHPG